MQVFDLQQVDYDEGYANGSTNGTVDAAFRNIQKNSTAFQIWKIENMSVVALPRDQYGTFFDGDSYIVYAASQYGQYSGIDTVNREIRGGPIELHIHFWLGAEATADKTGVAAYKTVEFDGYLGGNAVQHRETQGNESPRFKAYFKNGFRILKGGSATGFKSSATVFEPKLFKVKGKRTPIVIQMDHISWKYFNSGDSFLVVTPKTLFIWIGRASNRVEKLHSTKAAKEIKLEHNIPNIVFVDDGYEQTLHPDDKAEFNKFLPLEKRHVLPAEQGGDDENVEKQLRANIRLYRCSDNGGKYRVAEVKTGPFLQSDLDSDDVFILDHGLNGIWVWVGKRASEKERTEALRNARGFVKKKNYPNNTSVTRVVDGAEPVEFKMLFLLWKDKDETKGMGKTYTVGKIAKVAVTKFDAAIMHERPALAAESQLVDDGSGTIKIWRVKKFDLVEIPKERHGIFFTEDCYIVWYNYQASGQKYIIYYWLGLHAKQDEMGTAALKTIEKDNELEGVAVQARVIQGHEPAQFLQLFNGRMIIFKGKGTDYDESGRNHKIPANYLLHVVGTNSYSTKAIQVQHNAASLNSNYCFVLKKNRQFYIWCGSYSTGDQREMAKNYGGKDFELVLEGKEIQEFWENLGGKSAYMASKLIKDSNDARPARLFHCSTASGSFKAEEIFNFVQTDLVPEDVMLLDAHEVIYIWIGNLSTKEERRLILDTAKEYLRTDAAGRNLHTPIIKIKQGNEPANFTGFFGVWDKSLWTEHKSFEEIRLELDSKTCINGKENIRPGPQNGDYNFDQHVKYPISILKMANDELPAKIDAQKKELHLTHDDFVSLFKMPFAEFETLPKWKQQELKKKVGLF